MTGFDFLVLTLLGCLVGTIRHAYKLGYDDGRIFELSRQVERLEAEEAAQTGLRLILGGRHATQTDS